jgi:hypothetical protein
VVNSYGDTDNKLFGALDLIFFVCKRFYLSRRRRCSGAKLPFTMLWSPVAQNDWQHYSRRAEHNTKIRTEAMSNIYFNFAADTQLLQQSHVSGEIPTALRNSP